MKGVVHLILPASWTPFVGQEDYAPSVSEWFRAFPKMVSWLELYDFAAELAGKGAFAETDLGRDRRLGEKQ
jgi:hypothetical protein